MNTQGGAGVRAQGEKGRGRKERSERGTRDARGPRVASQRLSRGDLDLDLKPDVTCSVLINDERLAGPAAVALDTVGRYDELIASSNLTHRSKPRLVAPSSTSTLSPARASLDDGQPRRAVAIQTTCASAYIGAVGRSTQSQSYL